MEFPQSVKNLLYFDILQQKYLRATLASIQQQFRFLDKLLAVILQNCFFQTYRGYEKATQSYALHWICGWSGYDVHHSVPGRSGNNTGLFKMIVGVLTTCHTQYTWDRSICIFLFNFHRHVREFLN